jgi:FkbM family methyltransferase
MILEDIRAIFSNNRGISGGWPLFFDYLGCKFTSKWKQARHDHAPCEVTFRGLKISVPEFATFSSQFTDIFVHERDYFMSENPAARIMDIGANVGIGDLYFKMIYPDATIEAYEADPQTFSYLQKNMAQNNIKGVTCHNLAIGEEGKMSIYRLESSLSTTTRPDLMQGSVKKAEVPSKRLSQILAHPIDLLKIDCEGAEYELIDNSKEVLHFAKQIHLEYHALPGSSISPSSFATIEAAGFDVYVVDNNLTHRNVVDMPHPPYRMEIDAVRKN